MALEDTGASRDAERLARHRARQRAERGEEPLGWYAWAEPMYGSQSLTAEGLRVGEWAVEVLRSFLGDDFLQRAVEAKTGHSILLPPFWPANDVPWAFCCLFQLAAQIALLGDRAQPVQKDVLTNFQPSTWTHLLMQLEVAGLGLRDGWELTLESALNNAGKGDVHLQKGPETLRVETTALGPSRAEQKAHALSIRLMLRTSDLRIRYDVQVAGSTGQITSEAVMMEWLDAIEAAAAETAQDGTPRSVAGPDGALVHATKGVAEGEWATLDSGSFVNTIWSRILWRFKEKNDQYEGAGPVWFRLDDHDFAGLWQGTSLSTLPLSDKLASLAPLFRQVLATCPNLAGIVLAPSILWAGKFAADTALQMRDDAQGVAALRTPLPGYWCRESIFVSRSTPPDAGWAALVDWYEHESTWLEWALQRLGQPPFSTLFHQPL